MINKKYMNLIKKELKKEKSILIKYIPTEEEINYLKEFNILTEIKCIKQISLVSDYTYDTNYCLYYLNN